MPMQIVRGSRVSPHRSPVSVGAARRGTARAAVLVLVALTAASDCSRGAESSAKAAAGLGRPIGAAADEAALRRVRHFRDELNREDLPLSARAEWAVALFLEGTPEARRVLLDALRPGASSGVRAAVCVAVAGERLTALPPSEFDLPVLRALLEGDAALQAEAGAAIGRLAQRDGGTLTDRLTVLLYAERTSNELRAALLRAAGHVPHRAMMVLLLDELDGPVDPVVEAAAVEGLQRLTGRSGWTEADRFREAAGELMLMSEADFHDMARRLRVRRLQRLEEVRRTLEEDLADAQSDLLEARPAEQRAAFLAERLRHRQPSVRVWAAQRILGLTDREVSPAMLAPLLEGLSAEQNSVRAAYASAVPFVEQRVMRPGSPPAGPAPLRDRLDRETATEVSAAVIGALASYRDPADVERLARRLDDPRDRVAEAAANALAEFGRVQPGGSPPADAVRRVPRLLDLAARSDGPDSRPPAVRKAALSAAVRLAADRAALVPALLRLAEDKHPDVREAAVAALESVPAGPAVQAALTRLLADTNRRVRTAAIQVLGSTGRDERTRPVLTALESRLPDEPDAEVQRRLTAAMAGVAGKLPVEEQVALAARWGKAAGASRAAAVDLRRRLLDGGAGTLPTEDARRECLVELARLHEVSGEPAEAAARFRQAAVMLRVREPEPAVNAAAAAFRCLVAARQSKDAWAWAGDWAAMPPKTSAGVVPVPLRMLEELRPLADIAGGDAALLELLASVPDAPWVKAEPVAGKLAELRRLAVGKRNERLRAESVGLVRAWLTGGPAEKRAASAALLVAGDAGLAAVIARCEEELASARPDAAVEGELIRLARDLVAARPEKPFDPAAHKAAAPAAERRKLLAEWSALLAARLAAP